MAQNVVINDVQTKGNMIHHHKTGAWFLLCHPTPSGLEKILSDFPLAPENKNVTHETLMKMRKNVSSVRPMYQTGFVCRLDPTHKVEFEPRMEKFLKEDGKDVKSLCVGDLAFDIYEYNALCKVTYEDLEWDVDDTNSKDGAFFYEKSPAITDVPIRIMGYGNSR